MTRSNRLLGALISLGLCATFAGGQTIQKQSSPTVGFCEVASHPETYLNKPLRFRVIYRVGFEWEEIYSLRCVNAPSTWVEFSDTFDEFSSHNAIKQMDKGKHFSITVGLVLEGRLTGYGGGYGHMNGFPLAFTIDRVESAKRLDNHGFHRRELLPEDQRRIEQYENIIAPKRAVGCKAQTTKH